MSVSLMRIVGRFAFGFTVAVALTTFTGCGSSAPETVASNETASAPATQVASGKEAETVVGQFLDRIRRGGAENTAMELLTQRAQSELNRIGHTVQPLGSPDAEVTITRSEAVGMEHLPEDQKVPTRLVHCIWSEPSEADGSKQEFQIVLPVVQQTNGWRISGMVLGMATGEPELILDFENGDEMARILNAQEQTQTAANPNATATESLQR
ncbi:hypothetical protein [Rhodopirellula halodulae]|uniref:hypothetical protein n=1 Tax=Rhodopirellula halodulae TaxID=2894198 RepID=UPI001E5E16E2|nr:hypothetical protein [Rhodopirellula sp. JC737]MCC9655212.1 hypothetical protein [Rhodopirellula sp. JC737]